MATELKERPTFTCARCGITKQRTLYNGYTYNYAQKYCSRDCYHRSKRNERGWLNQEGYVKTKIKGRTLFMHRLVMSQMLGRELYPHETVHHKNGHRADNRPENLELWSTCHSRWQSVEDKIIWALEFLASYGYRIYK